MNTSIHILDCIPKLPTGKTEEESWILIPAYAWQVKLSVKDNNNLNAFEELIHKLLKNATYSDDQLVKMTHLHGDLVSRIRQELKNKGALDVPDSTKGTEQSRTNDLIGWVLQDPETGSIFYYFSSDFRPIKLDECITTKKPIKLDFGDDNANYIKWASLIDHPEHIPTRPDVRNVIQILDREFSKEFKSRQKNLRTLVPNKFITKQAGNTLGTKNVHRVTFMDSTPTKVWLPTAGIVMENSNQWFVCDPVGIGFSEQLKIRMERLEKEGNSTASKLIKELYSHTTHTDLYKGIDLTENKALAAQRITAAFGSRIFDYEAVTHQMKSFFEACLILEKFEDQVGVNEIEAVCGRGRKVLEALFKELGKRNPPTGLDSLLPKRNEDEHFELVKNHAMKMGYLEESLKRSTISPNKPWLKRSADDLSTYYMLSKVIGGLLLQASTQNDHPLRLAAKTAPDLFIDLAFICALGNTASHDGSHKPKDQQTVDIKDALSLRDKLTRVVRLLLDPKGTTFN